MMSRYLHNDKSSRFELPHDFGAGFNDADKFAIRQTNKTVRGWGQVAQRASRRAQRGNVCRGDGDFAAIAAMQHDQQRADQKLPPQVAPVHDPS